MKTFLSIIDVDEFRAKLPNLTFLQLEKICGINHDTIWKIFKGRSTVRFRTALKLSAAFNLQNTKFNAVPLKSTRSHRQRIQAAIFDRYEVLNALLNKNLSQAACANLCNICEYTLRSWLNGSNALRSKALILDKILGLKNTKYFTVC